MSPMSDGNRCGQAELVCTYAMQALPAAERAAVEAHIALCPHCRRELEALRPVVDSFVSGPADVLRPSASLADRLARRIAAETGTAPVLPVAPQWSEPEWDEVAPGIFCKMLATDVEKERVAMLVRLARGTDYPPHTHAGVEELHLLDGELWVDERKLRAGDYARAEPGTADRRVWSDTGCTCLLITSTRDVFL